MDLSVNEQLSHSDFGPHECNGLHTFPCGSQSKRTGSGSVELQQDIKDHTELEYQKSCDKLSNPAVTMLSSSVVTVLAPHWSGRLRRSKRFEGTRNSVYGSLQDVRNIKANQAHGGFQETQNQHGMESRLKDESQPRVRFLDTRSKTMDWATESGLSGVDCDAKRKMLQTFSMDVNSGRMDQREVDAGAIRHGVTTASPLSPRRNPQVGHQGTTSTLSSKPTTSSMLLSLRRINSGGLNTKTVSSFSEEDRSSDREGNLFTSHVPQTFLNKNEQDRPKSQIPPSSLSYRTKESRRALSTLSSNHRVRDTSESHLFPTSSVNRDTDGTLFTNEPQKGSKLAFMSREGLERQQIFRDSDKNTNLFSKSSVSTPRYLQYNPSSLPKTHPHPRVTTLTSTSWWKHVTPEGSSPQATNDPTNIKDQTNTLCDNNTHLALPGHVDNKRFSSQIPNNRDNKSTTESVSKGNLNAFMKPQRGTPNLRQRNSEDSTDQKTDRLFKQQYHSSLDTQESQKPHNLLVLSPSKIRRTASQTSLSHSTDLCKHDVSNSSFTANVTESPPTLLDPKHSNTPTESSRKYNNNNWSSKTNSSLASPQITDSENFTKQSLLLATTTTLNSEALTSKATSGLPPAPNINTSSCFLPYPVSSQTSTHTSAHTDFSPQTPKSINTAPPLGSITTSLHPKPASSLTPTVSVPKYITVSTASVSSSTTSCPIQSLMTSPAASDIASSHTPTTFSSLLTPPATPISTSPNYSKTPSPKEGRTFSSSPERDPKALHPHVEGKGARRVTWDDSVDLLHPESVTVEKPHLSPPRPQSPTRSPQSARATSIFSFLRSNNATTNTSPLRSPTPKTSSIEVGKGGKYRSLSSDSADLKSRDLERSKQRPCDPTNSYQGKQDLTTARQERTLSVESGTVQCSSSSPLAFPPDFSSAYKNRYSSTPYSALVSNRLTQGETKTLKIRSPLFSGPPRNIYGTHFPSHTDQHAAVTMPISKPPPLPVSPPQTISLPFENKTAMQESSKSRVSETSQVNNNHVKDRSQDNQNGQILLVDNRFHISPQSLPGESSCVTQILVYSIKPKVDTVNVAPKNATSKPFQYTGNTMVSLDNKLKELPLTIQSKGVSGEPCSRSNQSASGEISVESQSRDEGSHRGMKESVLGKSRFFSMENSSEQSPKKSRFALKKSISSPNSILSRSDSERASKTNNKMDQVLNKLKQTFSTKRSDDDPSFPWKWKRSTQTLPVSDSQIAGDINADTLRTLEQQEEGKAVLKDNEKITEGMNRCTIIPPSPVVGRTAGGNFPVWSDRSTPDTEHNEQVYAGHKSESKTQVHLTAHNQKIHQCDLYNNNRTDHIPTNHFPTHRDPSPGRSPNLSSGYPLFRKSTPSPRSPFSPFSSLAPLSPFTPPDVTDDSVFYSPKLQRRKESHSPCEPGEGISLGNSRRRLSTGPPSLSPGPAMEHLTSTYADLKYGIEPGKSFSVSSVLSSRPSGPGRISTGPRFKSVGDLSSLTSEGSGKDWDEWTSTSDWTAMSRVPRPSSNSRMPFSPSDPGEMRSRSLPRSLTRCLTNCSPEVLTSHPVTVVASTPYHLWGPKMNTCHFRWDTEGPPTPPPTPPMSPPSRRISKPTSPSSPVFPSLPGAQSGECQASRGHLPSRGYISSLTTFEESSDSSSDTTTDDEYYLETGEGEEKETEL